MNNKTLLNNLPENHPHHKEIMEIITEDELDLLPKTIINEDELLCTGEAFEEIALKDFHRNLMSILNEHFTRKQKIALLLRSEISSDIPITFKSCGDALFVSSSRAMQIYNKCLRKLRHPRFSDTLKPYRKRK